MCCEIMRSDPSGPPYYAAVFVCLATQSCCIELVSDRTAEAFLSALWRFVSRRGKPNEIWSDNATSFCRVLRIWIVIPYLVEHVL